ncbi:hypothetical protein T484DRAFT_1981943, partial [Baffinella frigidus]
MVATIRTLSRFPQKPPQGSPTFARSCATGSLRILPSPSPRTSPKPYFRPTSASTLW